jgi:hypothetical protein
MLLRLSEAQQLNEGLEDTLLRPALEAFAVEMRQHYLEELVQAVLKLERDTHRESYLAGRVDAYEVLLSDLRFFASEQLQQATAPA